MVDALVVAVRAALRERADPVRAPREQAYMKSAMPFLGVTMPVLHRVCADLFARHPLETEAEWKTAVLRLWREAQYREERYAAIDLAGHRLYRSHQTPRTVPMYEEIIVDGAWWDYVDGIAIRLIGTILLDHPDTRDLMLAWSRDGNLWKRRTAIICQNAARQRTDLNLLYECIEPNLADRDFFIRKAIGWALRDLAKTNPEEVRRYVDEKGSRLSGLSRREALRHIASG